MEKGLTLRSGMCPMQRYWPELLDHIQARRIDPTFIITHRIHLNDVAEAYKTFDKKEDGMIKVVVKTDFGLEMEKVDLGPVPGLAAALRKNVV